jgi:spore maturation protein CgeB
VTRQAMVRAGYSPSVRLFEAAACGVPIITDEWAGLADFFEPGREILVARSTEEALAIVRDLPEDERIRIAAAARKRFLEEHTASSRAVALERYTRELLRAHGARMRTKTTQSRVLS